MCQRVFEDYPNTQEILKDNFLADDFIKQNSGMVHKVVRKYMPEIVNTYEYEDYVQYGFEMLYNAMKLYNPNNNVKFSTYSYIAVRNKMLNKKRLESQKLNQLKSNVYSLNQLIPVADSETEIMELLPSDINVAEESIGNIQKENLNYIIETRIKPRLSDKGLQVFNYILEGKGQTEIAGIMGTSRQRVHQQVDKIRGMIEMTNILN